MRYLQLLLVFAVFIAAINKTAAETSQNSCQLTVETGDSLTFTPTSLSVSKSQCPSVSLTLKHSGEMASFIMGHNWVLSLAQDADGVYETGRSAGLENNYVDQNDTRVLAWTKLIGGGETTSITFSTETLSIDKAYRYICSFPGHYPAMTGTFTITR